MRVRTRAFAAAAVLALTTLAGCAGDDHHVDDRKSPSAHTMLASSQKAMDAAIAKSRTRMYNVPTKVTVREGSIYVTIGDDEDENTYSYARGLEPKVSLRFYESDRAMSYAYCLQATGPTLNNVVRTKSLTVQEAHDTRSGRPKNGTYIEEAYGSCPPADFAPIIPDDPTDDWADGAD